MAAWPGALDPHIAPEITSSALLVIDTQVDFVDGGSCPVPGATQVLPAITRLLRAYRTAHLPIMHVVRLYDGGDVDLPRRTLIDSGASIVRPGSAGSQIVHELQPDGAPALDPNLLLLGDRQPLAEHEWALWKPRWSAFHRTALDDHLHRLGVTTVVIAGCNYPNCPRATVYGASERDYRVLVVSDAISGIQPHHIQEAALMGVVCASSNEVIRNLNVRPPT